MKSFRLLVSATAVAALGCGVVLAAPSTTPGEPAGWQRGAHDVAGHDGGFRLHRVIEQLDLSAEQRTQVRAILEPLRPRLQALHQGGRANREQLATLAPTDPAYAGAVAQAKTHASEMIQLTSDAWTQVYAVLTPAQRAQVPGIVAAEREQRDARRQDWKQKRRAEPAG